MTAQQIIDALSAMPESVRQKELMVLNFPLLEDGNPAKAQLVTQARAVDNVPFIVIDYENS